MVFKIFINFVQYTTYHIWVIKIQSGRLLFVSSVCLLMILNKYLLIPTAFIEMQEQGESNLLIW